MYESGRSILLNKVMCGPSECIPGYEPERKPPPLADRDEPDYEGDRRKRSYAMQHAGCRLAVLAEVIWPEVCERLELMVGHAGFRRHSNRIVAMSET